MPMTHLPLGGDMRELTAHGTSGFPLEVYYNDPDLFGNGGVPWHWHEEAEFFLVLEGELEVAATDGIWRLPAGRCALVNCNSLHRMARSGPDRCRMLNIVFDTGIVAGRQGSVFEGKYVAPLKNSANISVALLPEKEAECLRRIGELLNGQEAGYEMEARALLSRAWLAALECCRARLDGAAAPAEDERIRRMLLYLQRYYAEDIHLADVARAVGVSERECTRCFRLRLDTTPFQYLTDYRIRVAARLLEEAPDMPVTEVCYAVGMSSPSYFARLFREHTGMTPREFRKGRSGG